MAAQPDQELAEAPELVGEDALRHGRLPGHRQVEQKGAGRGSPGHSIKAAPQLIAVGGEDHGGAGLRRRQPDRRVGEGANAGRQ